MCRPRQLGVSCDACEYFTQRGTCRLEEVEQELREQRNFLRSVVDLAQTMIVVLDGRFRTVTLNPFAENILQATQQDIAGKSWLTLVPPEYRAVLFRLLRKGFEGAVANGTVTALNALDGEVKFISWHVSPLDSHGQRNVLVIGHDVTEQVQHGQKLAHANRRLQAATLVASEMM